MTGFLYSQCYHEGSGCCCAPPRCPFRTEALHFWQLKVLSQISLWELPSAFPNVTYLLWEACIQWVVDEERYQGPDLWRQEGRITKDHSSSKDPHRISWDQLAIHTAVQLLPSHASLTLTDVISKSNPKKHFSWKSQSFRGYFFLMTLDIWYQKWPRKYQLKLDFEDGSPIGLLAMKTTSLGVDGELIVKMRYDCWHFKWWTEMGHWWEQAHGQVQYLRWLRFWGCWVVIIRIIIRWLLWGPLTP